MMAAGRSVCLLLALLPVAACFKDRPRPSPVEPEDSSLVSVQLIRPFENATVLAGRTVVVEVLGRGQGGRRLSGIGYVARRVEGGERIDSAALHFEPVALARDSFQLVVPAQLVTNTHLSITALAFPTSGSTRYSAGVQVVVAQCSSDIPACR